MSETGRRLTKSEILDVISKPGAKVYFVGVGGVSMISLFCLSRHFGISVSGSDRKCSLLTSALIDAGADIVIGEREAPDKDTALLVYSHAVAERTQIYERAGNSGGNESRVYGCDYAVL